MDLVFSSIIGAKEDAARESGTKYNPLRHKKGDNYRVYGDSGDERQTGRKTYSA